MSDLNTQIKAAIDSFDLDAARSLLRDAMKDADATTYYLASKVALDDEQKREFLEKAVALDPFHEQARQALKQVSGGTVSAPASSLAPVQASDPASSSNVISASESVARMVELDDEQFPLADMGSRLVGFLVDYALIWIVGILFAAIVNFIFYTLFTSGQDTGGAYFWEEGLLGITFDRNNETVLIGVFAFILMAVFLTIIVPLIPLPSIKKLRGQTIGKWLVGVQVVHLGGDLTFGRIIARQIGYYFSNLFFGLGFLWALWDDKRQTWHDKLVDTVVVKR